ncbi:DNA-binding transcriptional regulator, GntR family [Xaviernesmea oryzae]|uniref:DNA-binding transcriptional regulator, GntR family n=1 Tax=Xaviernesmea oryzae TaxID=464029 RepID=A0A1X7FP86_9HYPH|nr:GntR family transcriptional regulator [Xaviernesmea oryzae]SMF56059.1 DNA-binding transcriptional regulator, GntR family [Xaviernesmea oryzae]
MENKPEVGLLTVKKETIERQVYLTLRREILESRLQPGQRIIQDELASRLGTSRIPLRGALKALEANGLLTLDAKGYYSVADFGEADIQEIYSLRLLLEPHAAREAISKIRDDEITRLDHVNQAMKRAIIDGDRDRWTELNEEFHLTLYEACRQPRLTRIIRDLWSGRPTVSPIKSTQDLEQSAVEHSEMVDALNSRNATKLENLVRSHIEQGAYRWSEYRSSRHR